MTFIRSCAVFVCSGFAALFLIAGGAAAQSGFVLDQVFDATNNENMPVSWARDGNVVEVVFSIKYSSSCNGTYRVRFDFDRDITTLADGEEFSVRIRKLTSSANCGKKWTSAQVLPASNIRTAVSPYFPSAYETNGNIDGLSVKTVHMWPGGATDETSVLQAVAKKNTPYTAFALNVGHSSSYSQYVFLYRYVVQSGVSDTAGMEDGINLRGKDYHSFKQSQPDPAICLRACIDDGRCRAWTWVKPGVQGASSVCWLKNAIPEPETSDCCVSGTKLVK